MPPKAWLGYGGGTDDHLLDRPPESLDGIWNSATIKGVLGWSNRQEAVISARAKQVGLLPTAYSNLDEKHRKLEGGTVRWRLERSPGDTIVFHKGAVMSPFLFYGE
jgi:hypothetical protein